jgi:hypothetical protein
MFYWAIDEERGKACGKAERMQKPGFQKTHGYVFFDLASSLSPLAQFCSDAEKD